MLRYTHFPKAKMNIKVDTHNSRYLHHLFKFNGFKKIIDPITARKHIVIHPDNFITTSKKPDAINGNSVNTFYMIEGVRSKAVVISIRSLSRNWIPIIVLYK